MIDLKSNLVASASLSALIALLALPMSLHLVKKRIARSRCRRDHDVRCYSEGKYGQAIRAWVG